MPGLTPSPIGLRHPLLTTIRKGIQKGLHDGFCVAEGFHLLEEAERARCEVGAIVVAESVAGRFAHREVYQLPDRDFHELAATEHSQGVISLVRPPAWTIDQLFSGTALVVVLDGLQDPGNAGTIVRSAEAFGASGVLAIKGTVNLYNPKSLRASAGSLFRLPCVQGFDEEAALGALAAVTCYATVANGGQPIGEAALAAPAALIIGGEARGVSPALRGGSRKVMIPTTGVESLNAAVAASIVLYEASRQRR